MHWSVSGVVDWLAVSVAGGCGPCPGSVRLVAYVHSWVGGRFCWGQAGFCRLDGCGSRFRGNIGKGGGGWMVRFFGVPSVPPPLWRRLGAGAFEFLSVICAFRLLRVGGGACVRFFLAAPSLRLDRMLLLSGGNLT